MNDDPCDNPNCYCCYPENRCNCNSMPLNPELGDEYTCPDCNMYYKSIRLVESQMFLRAGPHAQKLMAKNAQDPIWVGRRNPK